MSGDANYQLIYSNMESESMNLNTIRTDSEYNFVKLFNEALAENDDIGTINGSPFDHGDNECKYYSPEKFAQNIHPTNNITITILSQLSQYQCKLGLHS